MRYQANLLKSILESHDSGSGDKGQGKGDSKGKGKAGGVPKMRQVQVVR